MGAVRDALTRWLGVGAILAVTACDDGSHCGGPPHDVFMCEAAPDGIGCSDPAPYEAGYIDGNPALAAPPGCAITYSMCHPYYPNTPLRAMCAEDGEGGYHWVVPL